MATKIVNGVTLYQPSVNDRLEPNTCYITREAIPNITSEYDVGYMFWTDDKGMFYGKHGDKKYYGDAGWFEKLGYDEEPVEDNDMVNSPPHYNVGEIECIDYLKDNLPVAAYQGYLEGNAKKYMHRWRYKGDSNKDLNKAIWYLSRLEEDIEERGIG